MLPWLLNLAERYLWSSKLRGLSLRRPEQDKYLLAAQGVGMRRLLEGLLDIFRATNSKRKYFCLLLHLEAMGLIHIPAAVKEIMARSRLQGVNEASRNIAITTSAEMPRIVYVQPNGAGPDVISFHEFAQAVQRNDDPVRRDSLVPCTNGQKCRQGIVV